MSRSLILAVKIIGDAKDAIAAMDAAASGTEKFQKGLSTAAKVSGIALGVIAVGAKQAVDAASDLQQSIGGVESVFGDYAAEMTAHATAAADAVGLSQNQYNEAATLLGSQLKNMGLGMDEVAGSTNDLIGLGSDLAATFGGTTADATAALSSLLRGERDPIEKYGVAIKQADVDARKAAMGLDGLTGEAAKNADLQATLALLTEQTADAQGQFARETDTAAGSAQIAAANFENAKAALGEALLPIVTEISQRLAELAIWFQENATWITPLIGVVAGLAAGIIVMNGAMKAWAAVQAIQTAAQWANNAAWLASPITWIILAVIAAIAVLVTTIVLVIKHWDQIKAVAAVVWAAVINWIKQAISWLGDRFGAPIRSALNTFYNLRDGAVSVFQSIIDWVRNAIDWIADLASNAVPGWAKDLLGMSRQSLTIEPQLAAFTAPDYRSTMRVATTFDTPATTPFAAPIATSNFSAMGVMLAALSMPQVKPTATATQVNDNRRIEINLPNYMGDKVEIIAELREALADLDQSHDGIIYA